MVKTNTVDTSWVYHRTKQERGRPHPRLLAEVKRGRLRSKEMKGDMRHRANEESTVTRNTKLKK